MQERERFINHINDLIDYVDSTEEDKREALKALAFNIMCVLDGSVVTMPHYSLIPLRTKVQFDSVEKILNINTNVIDIAGSLHELL